jgi:hypothetical protein
MDQNQSNEVNGKEALKKDLINLENSGLTDGRIVDSEKPENQEWNAREKQNAGGSMENNGTPNIEPNRPDEEQSTSPNRPDTEIDPGKPATETEVDLDRDRTQTYPDKTPPERH